MKKGLFSIVGMRKKKVGIAIICGALIFALGTGFAFAANMSGGNDTTSVDIPLIGDPAVCVAQVTLTESNPYVYVDIGSLPPGMKSVNIRVHDDIYDADNRNNDTLQMYFNGNMAITFCGPEMIPGHTYYVMMSANGASGRVFIGAFAALDGQTTSLEAS